MFGSRTRQLWKLHDELKEKGMADNACLVVDLSRLPGYFISKHRGVPPKCLLVDVSPGQHLAIFVRGGFWEFMEMHSSGGEPMPTKTSPDRIAPKDNSIAHDVLALIRQKSQDL